MLDPLLAEIAAVYASASTYADHGRQWPTGSRSIPSSTFEMRFERDRSFDVTVVHDDDRDDMRLGLSWTPESLSVEPTRLGARPTCLPEAIAMLTGVTFGIAQTIPRLLLPHEVPGCSLFDDVRAVTLGEKLRHDDRSCRVVDLASRFGRTRLVIDERTLVIRIVEEHDRLIRGTMVRTEHHPSIET